MMHGQTKIMFMSLILRTLNRVIQKTAALHSVSEPTKRVCKSSYKIYVFNEFQRKLNIKSNTDLF